GGSPGWYEQAVFTPDMKDVIWMSSRGTPTWYHTVVTGAQAASYDPPLENEVFGPFFVLTVLDPKFRTDLYELDLGTHAVRRLTDLDQVVPEFYFDPSGTELIWTTGNHSHTYLGTFSPAPAVVAPARVGPGRAWGGAPDPRRPHATPAGTDHIHQLGPPHASAPGARGHLADGGPALPTRTPAPGAARWRFVLPGPGMRDRATCRRAAPVRSRPGRSRAPGRRRSGTRHRSSRDQRMRRGRA